MKLASLLNWQAVARGFGGLALWRIRSEPESSVGDGDRLPQPENLPSLITVIIIDLERGAPSTGVIRTRSHTPCSSAVTAACWNWDLFLPLHYLTVCWWIGVKFSNVAPVPLAALPMILAVWQTEKHRKQQEMSLRTLRCKISGVPGLHVQSFQILLFFFFLYAQLMIPSYCVFQLPFRLLCEVFYCVRCGFVRRDGLLFSLGFPLVCLVKALTDLQSSTSSVAPDV